jgi:hypothetical protein
LEPIGCRNDLSVLQPWLNTYNLIGPLELISMIPSSSKNVPIVVIGRNEGDRLKRCLRAAMKTATMVVYVDSGSADASVAYGDQRAAMLSNSIHRNRSAQRVPGMKTSHS